MKIPNQAFDIFSLAAMLLLYYNIFPIFVEFAAQDDRAIWAFGATIVTYLIFGSQIEKVVRRFL